MCWEGKINQFASCTQRSEGACAYGMMAEGIRDPFWEKQLTSAGEITKFSSKAASAFSQWPAQPGGGKQMKSPPCLWIILMVLSNTLESFTQSKGSAALPRKPPAGTFPPAQLRPTDCTSPHRCLSWYEAAVRHGISLRAPFCFDKLTARSCAQSLKQGTA